MKTKWLPLSLEGATLAGVVLFFSLPTIGRGEDCLWKSNGSGKWEIAGNWAPGLPSSSSLVYFTNATTKTVTIDATTVLSNAINGCMTISNLQLSALVGTNTLSLNSPGTNVPLRILRYYLDSYGSKLNATNAAIRVDGPVFSAYRVNMSRCSIMATGATLSVTMMTLSNSTVTVRDTSVHTNLTIVGGTFTEWSNLNLNGGSKMWINGGDLSVSNASILLGQDGHAEMTVSNGTVRTQALNIPGTIGPPDRGGSVLTLAGGTITISSSFNVAGWAWVTGGQLVLTNVNNTVIAGHGSTFIEGDIAQMTVSNARVLANQITLASNGAVSVAYGPGRLTIQSGGLVAARGPLRIGYFSILTGVVDIAGGQLVITNRPADVTAEVGTLSSRLSVDGELIVRYHSSLVMTKPSVAMNSIGLNGTGTLTIDGGKVTLRSTLAIGYALNSVGTVSVTDGTLENSEAITYIGNRGTGRMTLSNGVFGALYVYLGYSDGRGTLTMGGSSTLVCSNLNVGGGAGSTGSLVIYGGTNRVFGSLVVGNLGCTATSTVLIAGGSLLVSNGAHNAVLDIRSGTVTLNSGTLAANRLVITNVCGRFFHLGGTLVTNVVTISASLDADGDGLPNGWEQQYGLDPFYPYGKDGPDADKDGDGQSNLAEFLAGTDPTNSASALRITAIGREGNDLRVTWMTAPHKITALERTAGAAATYSNNFSTIFIATNTTGTVTNYLDSGAVTNTPARYYRVRLVP
jgi:hypothetical protein